MVRIAVQPEVLRWAASRSAKPEHELQSRFPRLQLWLSGEDSPTLNQLEQFSKVTATPLGFLFLQKPPVDRITIPHFRTLDDRAIATPSTELIDTVHLMQRRQDWLGEYLRSEGRLPVPLVNCAKETEPVPDVATRIRDLLGLAPAWASDFPTWTKALAGFRDAISKAGIIVVTNGVVGNNTHRKLDVDDFRGFVLVDTHAPLIFVNGTDAKAAQMFTLAHELAHLAFGKSAAFDLRMLRPAPAAVEQVCNKVAAEFLVPEQSLRTQWSRSLDSVEGVARTFKVSQIVAARRLLDLRLISNDEFSGFYEQYINAERRHPGQESGGDFYATAAYRIGPRFASEVIRAVNAGHLLYNDAFRLTGLNGKTFPEFAKRMQEGGLD